MQAIVPKLKRGDLSECSFAFRAVRQTWSEDKTERTIRECSIHRGDVSLVTTAANANATASLRAGELTLEQRERIAARIGERVCGPYSTPDPLPAGSSRRPWLMRSNVEWAKARRAHLRADRRATLPPHVAPRRYTYAEVQALGRQGRAYKKRNGTYSFPIVDEEDLRNAIHAIGRAPANERLAVKRWIVISAQRLSRKGILPPGWWDEVNDATPHGLPG